MFVLAVLLLDSLSRYGEKLEAVVGMVAIGVLLLVINWFFHRVYWTEWIKGHRNRGKALTGAALGGRGRRRDGRRPLHARLHQRLPRGVRDGPLPAGAAAQLRHRRRPRRASRSAWSLTAVVGAITFALERKLPYKKMLIVTGVLIALVLVVLVGNTARTMQGVGWLPIHPIEVEFPLWMGTWLGIYPTVETLAAQALAFAFVVGSYFAAEWMRKRELRRAIAAQRGSLDGDRGESRRPPPATAPRPIGSGDDAVEAPPHSLSRR